MAPAQPKPIRNTTSRHGSEEDVSTQQAGRSATALAAASSAFNLRQQAQRSQLRESSSAPALKSTNLLRKKSRPVSQLQEIGDVSDTEEVDDARQNSPTRPGTAPLIQVSSTESGSESRNPSRVPSADASPEARPSDVLLSKIPIPPIPMSPSERPPLRPSTARSEMSKRNSQLSLAPKSLRDLGADFDPYRIASRSNSHLDLSKLESHPGLLMAGSRSSVDLLKRYSNPFGDSKRFSSAWHSAVSTRPASPVEEVDEKVPESHIAAFHGAPEEFDEKTFPLYVDDRLANTEHYALFVDGEEDDDYLHNVRYDDDIRYKARLRDRFTRENICSTLGMILMICGLLCVFVVLPIVSYTGTSLIPYGYNTPLDQMPGIIKGVDKSSWSYVNDKQYDLLSNIRKGLVDPDTPSDVMYKTAFDGTQLKLTFSDEFNTENRTFYEGDDPYWAGFEGWYGATQDLEWYDPDALNTGDGVLEIGLDKFSSHGLLYRSGMLQSWNKMCFKGGVFEVSVSLAGPAGVHGFWPGIWSMGNLARPGYLASSDGLWPYSYNESDPSGISKLPGQRLNKCTCDSEDGEQTHPNPGTGRGAPEIDVLEASADWGGLGLGVATQSSQVAPFDIWYYPDYDFMETPQYNTSFVNTYTGGPFQQAISTTTVLNNDWYDGVQYQKYSFEYEPGSDQSAYVMWRVGDEEMMRFDARTHAANGNIGPRVVSEEPMSMILNLGFSNSWTFIDWQKLHFPTFMRIDYVRIYQSEDHFLTCDPPGYPTTEYIAQHPEAYNNPNLTLWSETPYEWPKNTLMHGCQQAVG